MSSNIQCVYEVSERLRKYIDRQVGPRPQSSQVEKDGNESNGNIESMKRIIRREEELLKHIHDMLELLEAIG